MKGQARLRLYGFLLILSATMFGIMRIVYRHCQRLGNRIHLSDLLGSGVGRRACVRCPQVRSDERNALLSLWLAHAR